MCSAHKVSGRTDIAVKEQESEQDNTTVSEIEQQETAMNNTKNHFYGNVCKILNSNTTTL